MIQLADDLHFDEIPYVRSDSYYDEVPEVVETIENPLEDDVEELELDEVEEVIEDISHLLEEIKPDPTDVPEPVTLLAKQAEEKSKLEQKFPFMAAAMAFAARQREKKPQEALRPAPVNQDDLDDPWFETAPVLSEDPEIEEKPKGWFARLGEKMATAMDRFGSFLDYAVPSSSALAVVASLGVGASTLNKIEQMPMPEPIKIEVAATPQATGPQVTMNTMQPMVVTPAVKELPSARTLAETQPDAASLNDLLIKKNIEIVQAAGGEKASYLHSEKAHGDFVKMLRKATGFDGVLNHPEVQKAKNIAEMVNLVDQYFGENIADLIESNAASMHLSASNIAALR